MITTGAACWVVVVTGCPSRRISRCDGQVALEVGLLVDGELQAAAPDGGDDLLVELEGRDLGLTTGILRGVDGGEPDGSGEGDHLVDRGVLLQLR